MFYTVSSFYFILYLSLPLSPYLILRLKNFRFSSFLFIFFICYPRLFPLDVPLYAFGKQTRISAQNPCVRASYFSITANKKEDSMFYTVSSFYFILYLSLPLSPYLILRVKKFHFSLQKRLTLSL